jgi:hypothetical protein
LGADQIQDLVVLLPVERTGTVLQQVVLRSQEEQALLLSNIVEMRS